MYYAVVNLDDGLVVSVESTTQAAQNTVEAIRQSAKPRLFPPVRTTLIMLVDRVIFVAYSEGKTLHFDVDSTHDSGKRLVPIVRVV